MCARAVDQSFSNSDHESPWTGNDVTASCMTSSGEFPRRRRRGIPPAWRYSLPSSITHSITASIAVQQSVDNTLPSPVSISGNEAVSGVDRRRKYMATGSRNVAESGPRIRPTCLRYSYWLTLDERRSYVNSKYSTSTADKFGGHENQLKRHFRPQSCEIINRKSVSSCGFDDDDDGHVLRRHLNCSHVTESSASEQVISSSTSAFDVKTDCGGDHVDCSAVRLNSDRDRRFSDVTVDGSRDGVKGQRRLSLSKIGDSGLGASIHSDQNSPEETGALDLSHHHNLPEQQQQRRLDQRLLCDNDNDNDDDDDVTNDVGESQCQTRSEGQCEHCGQGECQGHIDEDDEDGDNLILLTRYKREYLLWHLSMIYLSCIIVYCLIATLISSTRFVRTVRQYNICQACFPLFCSGTMGSLPRTVILTTTH